MTSIPIEPVSGLRRRRCPAAPRRPTAIDRCIGQTVRTLRRTKGISQASLADTIGVSFPQMQKYEKGTNRLSVSALIRIADALGISPHDIITDACAELSRSLVVAPDTSRPS